METVLTVICITQMIVNIMMYALVLQNDMKTTRRMRQQRTELLDLVHQHQQWIEITQRSTSLHGLRQQSKSELLQEEKKGLKT